MHDDFLSRYLAAFSSIPGWFWPDAYLILAAYHQLLAEEGLAGDVLEIGVYHGLSAIGTAALRGEGRRFVAVDPFDEAEPGAAAAPGLPTRATFLRNMGRFYRDLSFLTTIAAPSASVRPQDLGSAFTLCHIDGLHSEEATYADLELCAAISAPGGLIAIDDYFEPAFPGVAEAAIRFNIEHPGTLAPIAIGFKKALFQRQPAPFNLNARFTQSFPQVVASRALLWRTPVHFFDTAVTVAFDCSLSTPRRLVPAGSGIAARIEGPPAAVTACAGETVNVPVHVTNLSRMPLGCDGSPFGLSYHLFTADHAPLQFDHERQWFREPLPPGRSRTIHVPVHVPQEPGRYELEFDIVWEGVLWMKDIRNPTAVVPLLAIGGPGGNYVG